jgi:hypothetical protein
MRNLKTEEKDLQAMIFGGFFNETAQPYPTTVRILGVAFSAYINIHF